MNRKPTKTYRIGPCMEAVAAYVRENPGCPKIGPARHVAPKGSLMYGYRSVDRAIRAGLVVAKRGKNGTYSLTIAD